MSDIRDTLAQLDRRLSDLKREIASIGEEPEAQPASSVRSGISADRPTAPAAPAAPPVRAPEQLFGAAAHPAPEPQAAPAERPSHASYAGDIPSSVPAFAPPPLPRMAPPPQASEPLEPPPYEQAPPEMWAEVPSPPAYVAGQAAPGEGAPQQIVARAEAEAARLLAHAHERVDELKAQIERLLGVRERLLQSARDLVRQYEEEVNQLELSYPAQTIAEATAAAEQAHHAAPAASPPPPGVQARVEAGIGPMPAVAEPAAAAPPLPAATPAPEPPPRPALFEGVVTVTVPWVSRLQTIQVLEDSLTRVRGAQLAYVRGYHQGEARLELVLGEAVDLIGELNRVLPYAFAVESARQDEIVIRLERGEGGGRDVR